MLVPVVWFEESAMIPEEAARKFKTLYTDRIRMVNIVLTSLFLAALGLLAIDMRLLVGHYWRCFNIKMNCKGSGPANVSDSRDHLKESSTASSRTSSSLAASGGGRVRRVRKPPDTGALDSSRSGTETEEDDDEQDIGSRKRAAKSYAKRALSGINLPLLASNIVASSNQQQQVVSPTTNNGGNKSVEFAVHYNETLLVDRSQFGQRPNLSQADEKSTVAVGSDQSANRLSATEVAQLPPPPSSNRQQ